MHIHWSNFRTLQSDCQTLFSSYYLPKSDSQNSRLSIVAEEHRQEQGDGLDHSHQRKEDPSEDSQQIVEFERTEIAASDEHPIDHQDLDLKSAVSTGLGSRVLHFAHLVESLGSDRRIEGRREMLGCMCLECLRSRERFEENKYRSCQLEVGLCPTIDC